MNEKLNLTNHTFKKYEYDEFQLYDDAVDAIDVDYKYVRRSIPVSGSNWFIWEFLDCGGPTQEWVQIPNVKFMKELEKLYQEWKLTLS